MRELDDPLNARVHAYITHGLTAAEREWPRFANTFRDVGELSINELNTHPDLGDRLRDLMPAGAEWGIIACCNVLRARNGVVFALARGMDHLYFRCGMTPLATIAGANLTAELGPDWHGVNAWQSAFGTKETLHLHRDLCVVAHEHALALTTD